MRACTSAYVLVCVQVILCFMELMHTHIHKIDGLLLKLRESLVNRKVTPDPAGSVDLLRNCQGERPCPESRRGKMGGRKFQLASDMSW